MIGRPPRLSRIDTFESELAQIESIDERVNHSNWIISIDPVIQTFRKERGLTTFHTLDEALHPAIPPYCTGITSRVPDQERFYTAKVISRFLRWFTR